MLVPKQKRWQGSTIYCCPVCSYDSSNRERVAQHIRLIHPGQRRIEEAAHSELGNTGNRSRRQRGGGDNEQEKDSGS